MKALILNSGLGRRMGELTSEQPKCMTKISDKENILGRQLRLLFEAGITEVVITTGYLSNVIYKFCNQFFENMQITFVENPLYKETNYIYSIYCARDYLDDDIIMLHGDLVFEASVLDDLLECENSCMKVSSTRKIPEKDFKAVVDNGIVKKVGVNFLENAMEAQAFYKLKRKDWKRWLEQISKYCESNVLSEKKCYAEDALNDLNGECGIHALDVRDRLCAEVDTKEDLEDIRGQLNEIENNMVYMCFSTDVIHSAHISIIKRAQKLGRLIVGVLSDEAVVSYKRFPLIPFEERKIIFENIAGVERVVEQKTLSYKDNLLALKPKYVVHGDDWKSGVQKIIRDEVYNTLATYGGELIEYPYTNDKKYLEFERRVRAELSMPDMRRGRLRKVLAMKGIICAMEAHSGLTGLIVENTIVEEAGGARQFDAIWVSSLCDSIARGKPDIELVDMTSRFRTIDDICEVTTKPIIFDGDTGGLVDHFIYTVRSLERMGVSMIIIEDKIGLKKNSLFGNEVVQKQDSIENFCAKILAGKKAQRTADFMICARIESLILEQGMEDAIKRAFAYTDAGADAIMIHSRKKEPDEVFEFIEKYRKKYLSIPIVVVPTTYSSVREEEFKERGANIVIYANHFTRSSFPAMENAAKTILRNHRGKECDEICMPFKEIIRLIPEE